jgi:type VI secretion system protein ImpE
MTLDRTLSEEVAAAMDAVRSAPAAIAPRMALFQVASITGDWHRARTQLETMAKLDAECTLLVHTYTRLIDAEAVRIRVFAGIEQPIAFGPPPSWLAMMAQAITLDCRGDPGGAHTLRQIAREDTPARPGTLNGQSFEWIMDADPRLGATLEVVVEGQYRWLPLDHVAELRANAPGSVQDLVWQPVTLRVTTGTELKAFIPSRYPGSEKHSDDAIRLCRATRWIEKGDEQWGLGQRIFATEQDDFAILDVRRVYFNASGPRSDG